MEEEILLNINFNSSEIKAATGNIVSARKEIDALIAVNKQLVAQGEKNSAAYVKNEQTIKALNSEVASNSKIIQANTQANKQNADSINELKKRNSEIIKLRNEESTATAEGRKRISELNAEYDKNSATIAENSTQVEKQRFNIGNYSSALSGISPQLGAFSTNLGSAANATGGVTSGIFSMVKASIAFVATPLGAAIAALVVGFKALQTFVTGSTAGMDLFEDVSASVGAVLDIVTDRVVKLIGGIGKLLSGDFSGGLDDIQSSFSGIGDEIEREIALTLELNNAIRNLEDAEINYDIAASETSNTIKELLLQAKNRTLSEKDRIALLTKATELESKMNAELIKNKQEALRITNEEANKRVQIARIAGETEAEFGKRLLDTGLLLDEQRDKVKDSIIAFNGALGEGIAVREKVQNQIDALQEKAEEAAQKRADADAKRAEDAEKKRLEIIKRISAAENEAELLKLQRELSETKSLDDRTEKLIEIEKLKAEQLLENADLVEQERQNIISESETAISDIMKTFADERLAEQQEDLAEALSGYQEYVQGLINAKKQELLEGTISQEEYNQEITDLNIAGLEMQKVIKETYGAEDVALNGRIIDAKIAQGQAEVEIKKRQEAAKVDAVKNALGSIASVFNRNSIAFKALASAQTLINTFQSATSVFAGMTEAIPGPVGIALGIAASAAAVIRGLSDVAAINNVNLPKLAKGGRIRGKSHAQGGEVVTIGGQPVAEVEGGEDFFVVKKGATDMVRSLSMVNQLAGGRNFFSDRAPRYHNADGGIIARQAASGLGGFSPDLLVNALQGINIFTKVTDLERIQERNAIASTFSDLQ